MTNDVEKSLCTYKSLVIYSSCEVVVSTFWQVLVGSYWVARVMDIYVRYTYYG